MAVTSASARGSSTAPSFTVPAGAAVGDVFTVTLLLNNSDVITGTPAGLVQREAFTSGSAITARHYTMVLDGTTTTAGQSKTWSLSASRQWNITAVGQDGVDTAAPYVDSGVAYVAAATYTLPILPALAADSLIHAHVHAKGNGTTITSFGPAPSGWTKATDSTGSGTFGFAGSCGTRDATALAGDTPGGETWGAANQTPGSVIRFTTALKSAAVTPESHTGTASLSGSGVLSAVAMVALAASVALSGAGGLTASGSPATARTAAFTGTGSLAAATTPRPAVGVALTGSGSLVATGGPSVARTASLTGSGSLTAAGTPNATRTAALAGSGTLTATGSGSQAGSATAALTGTGALTATTTPQATTTAALSGTGSLAATGSGSEAGSATAALTGAGTLTASTSPALTTTVSLTGAGSLAATAVPAVTGSALLTGEGALTADGFNPDQRHDITVTASLEPRRWAATLDERTVTGSLADRDATGQLDPRRWTADLPDRRWTGALT